MQRIVNTTETRKQNQKFVLDYVRHQGPLSSANIAQALNVPAGTIARVTASLIEIGLLETVKVKMSKGVGKPPVMLDINKKFALLAGVELNELSTKVIITDFKGKILSKQVIKTSTIKGNLVKNLSELILSMVERAKTPSGLLKGVGIGISGVISPDGKTIMQGFLPLGLNITQLLEEELKLPVSGGNDANLAVLAEKHFGNAKEHGNIICLLDRGWVGAGLYLNNQLYAGSNNAAGELVAGLQGDCKVGNERLTTFPFIESYALERQIKETNFDNFSIDDFSSREEFIKELAELAKKGNGNAMDLIKGEVLRFSTALYRLSALFDPDLLIITGDIAYAGEFAEEMINTKFKKLFSGWPTIPPVEFAFSKLNQSGVALGAISMAIEELSNSELG